MAPLIGKAAPTWLALAVAAFVLGGLFARSMQLTPGRGWMVGGLWTAMTLAFEFGFSIAS